MAETVAWLDGARCAIADLPYCHQTSHGPLVEFPTAWCNNDAPFFLWSSVPSAPRPAPEPHG